MNEWRSRGKPQITLPRKWCRRKEQRKPQITHPRKWCKGADETTDNTPQKMMQRKGAEETTDNTPQKMMQRKGAEETTDNTPQKMMQRKGAEKITEPWVNHRKHTPENDAEERSRENHRTTSKPQTTHPRKWCAVCSLKQDCVGSTVMTTMSSIIHGNMTLKLRINLFNGWGIYTPLPTKRQHWDQ